jgi:hypothetical protein
LSADVLTIIKKNDHLLFLLKMNNLDADNRGRYETIEEQEIRYNYELVDSKYYLENLLGRSVNYLCWPGGGYNDLSMRIAVKAGYKASTFSQKSLISSGSSRIDIIERSGYGSFVKSKERWKQIKYKQLSA